jgi:phospholipid transport system substrate-binding protein
MLLLAWAVAFIVLAAGSAPAGQATDQLRPAVDKMIKTLEDPQLRGAARAPDRRRQIRAITDGVFDWTEMSRRVLGRHWNARSEPERAEFVRLFTELLERTYIGKIEKYSGETIRFLGESVDGDQATVRTALATRQGAEIPMDYRMVRRGDQWRIYDVIVEGVGLVNNYRTQFDHVLRTASYEELVRRIKERS